MSKKSFVVFVLGLMLFAGAAFLYDEYRIPTLIPNDYDCGNHPGIISDSKPFFFESSQDYIDRKGKAVQKQIERVCD